MPKADWPEVTFKWLKTDDGIPKAQGSIKNGSTFLRGLRLRLDGSDISSGKVLPLWSNQYFDLLPNETVECTIEIRMENNQALGKIFLVAETLQGADSYKYSIPKLFKIE